MIFSLALIFILFFFIVYSLLVFYFIYKRFINKAKLRNKFNFPFDTKICAFFHPSCNGGGGGERVLWEGIKVIQNKFPKAFCVVYCDDIPSSDDSILENVNIIFGIRIEKPIQFVRLQYCSLLQASKYKRFTMIGQSLGSILVGLEAINKCVPNIYFDTVGYAFTFPIFKLLGLCKTVAYIHYPTISSDMLLSVTNREISINNNSLIKNSQFFTYLKVYYYRIFAFFYFLVGKAVDCVIVNSSWTKSHIVSIWGREVKVIYPPCDVAKIKFYFHNLTKYRKRPWIISVGQFRPEKDHLLQLYAFKLFIDNYKQNVNKIYEDDIKLVLIGGCRSSEDKDRVRYLQSKCEQLNIQSYVKFKCNINYKEMLHCFEEGLIGLHTMKNEHFGIAIVEYMAAGMIPVVHNSGGPKLDIIDHGLNGFLATTAEEYSKIFDNIMSKPYDYWSELRNEAKTKSVLFDCQNFYSSMNNNLNDILN